MKLLQGDVIVLDELALEAIESGVIPRIEKSLVEVREMFGITPELEKLVRELPQESTIDQLLRMRGIR